MAKAETKEALKEEAKPIRFLIGVGGCEDKKKYPHAPSTCIFKQGMIVQGPSPAEAAFVKSGIAEFIEVVSLAETTRMIKKALPKSDVTDYKVEKAIKAGEINGSNLDGGEWEISKESVEAFIARMRG